jgi:hypothetical protein
MILLLNNQILNVEGKSSFSSELISNQLGSNFNDTDSTPWVGDLLGTEALLPQWLLKAYQDNPRDVTIVPFIKYYFRWLLSQEFGYGAQLNWENIRAPLYMNSIFLEALAEFYFPGFDFSVPLYKNILPNIRKFSTKVDENYFNIKGTPQAIKYLITTLLGFDWNDIFIVSTSPAVFEIQVASDQILELQKYENFLKEYAIPAGVVLTYKVI